MMTSIWQIMQILDSPSVAYYGIPKSYLILTAFHLLEKIKTMPLIVAVIKGYCSISLTLPVDPR